MTLDEVLQKLHALAEPEKVIFKREKYGIVAHNALGIYHKDLKLLAKDIGWDEALGEALFNTGIYEARLLCSKIIKASTVDPNHLEVWVKTFENWEVTDSFCMGIVAKSEFALPKIREWTQREPEFEKRAGFATMAAYTMADKKAENSIYESFLPLIEAAANDGRLYVKKAVNWALRSIGKRNRDLRVLAIETAKRIALQDSKSAQWIAKDALKELEGESLNVLDYPRSVYRP